MVGYRRPVPMPFSSLHEYTFGENIKFCFLSWSRCTDGTVCGWLDLRPCDREKVERALKEMFG